MTTRASDGFFMQMRNSRELFECCSKLVLPNFLSRFCRQPSIQLPPNAEAGDNTLQEDDHLYSTSESSLKVPLDQVPANLSYDTPNPILLRTWQ